MTAAFIKVLTCCVLENELCPHAHIVGAVRNAFLIFCSRKLFCHAFRLPPTWLSVFSFGRWQASLILAPRDFCATTSILRSSGMPLLSHQTLGLKGNYQNVPALKWINPRIVHNLTEFIYSKLQPNPHFNMGMPLSRILSTASTPLLA